MPSREGLGEMLQVGKGVQSRGPWRVSSLGKTKEGIHIGAGLYLTFKACGQCRERNYSNGK